MTEAERLYRKGTKLLDSDPEKAIELLSNSLELEPNAPPAIYNRVAAYARVGRDDEANADIDRLNQIAPELASELRGEMSLAAAPYTSLASMEFDAKNLEKAILYCNSALAYDPRFGDAWVIKGLSYKELGNIDEALKCYNTAAKVEPENFWAFINRAVLFHDQGKLRESITDYSKSIELKPEDPAAFLGRSAVYSDLGLTDLAAADYATAGLLKEKDIEAIES